MLHQIRNILATFPQRGKRDRKRTQPVKEVGPELPLSDHFLQIEIGGGHHASVHVNGARAAQPLEFLLLQRPQQLPLKPTPRC
jgi:hypothetical protein